LAGIFIFFHIRLFSLRFAIFSLLFLAGVGCIPILARPPAKNKAYKVSLSFAHPEPFSGPAMEKIRGRFSAEKAWAVMPDPFKKALGLGLLPVFFSFSIRPGTADGGPGLRAEAEVDPTLKKEVRMELYAFLYDYFHVLCSHAKDSPELGIRFSTDHWSAAKGAWFQEIVPQLDKAKE
jgi:hypothetical protein